MLLNVLRVNKSKRMKTYTELRNERMKRLKQDDTPNSEGRSKNGERETKTCRK